MTVLMGKGMLSRHWRVLSSYLDVEHEAPTWKDKHGERETMVDKNEQVESKFYC